MSFDSASLAGKGHVLGHTKTGAPIHTKVDHINHKTFTKKEHRDAAKLHKELIEIVYNKLKQQNITVPPKAIAYFLEKLQERQAEWESKIIKTKDTNVSQEKSIIEVLTELGFEGIKKAIPHLSPENKQVLASILSEVEKSVSVDSYNPTAKKVPVVDLEVAINNLIPDEKNDESSLLEGTDQIENQGDKTPEPLVATNVAKTINWAGKNYLSTNGRFHISVEDVLNSPQEQISKSEAPLTELEQLVINKQDKDWVQVQQERLLEKLDISQLTKTEDASLADQIDAMLNETKAHRSKILGK